MISKTHEVRPIDPATGEVYRRSAVPYFAVRCDYCGATAGELCTMPSGAVRRSSVKSDRGRPSPHLVRFDGVPKTGKWIVAAASDIPDFGLKEDDELLIERKHYSEKCFVIARLSDGYSPDAALYPGEVDFVRLATPKERNSFQ